MHYELSPYALLQASKQRKNTTMTTVYDLYSAAHSLHAHAPEASNIVAQQECAADEPVGPASAPIRTSPAQKTHYIADIQRRHNAAVRRSSLT